MQTFVQAYVMTDGGPDNASMLYVLYLYNKAFEQSQMGYASALAWIRRFRYPSRLRRCPDLSVRVVDF